MRTLFQTPAGFRLADMADGGRSWRGGVWQGAAYASGEGVPPPPQPPADDGPDAPPPIEEPPMPIPVPPDPGPPPMQLQRVPA